ncbi:MAG: hypothetical protein ACC661_07055 [Verrucomicrobiales bacterium]
MPHRHILALLLVCSLLGLGMGRRAGDTVISFHNEGHEAEVPKFSFAHKVGGSGNTRYFKVMPDVTEMDILWFYPFPAEDGTTRGAVFKLNHKGTDALHQLSSMNMGKLLLAIVEPNHSSALLIDERIEDGMLVIWAGLDEENIKLLRGEIHEHVPEETAQDPGAMEADPAAGEPAKKKKKFRLWPFKPKHREAIE